jgi:protein TonB
VDGRPRRLTPALTISVVIHATAVLLIVLLFRSLEDRRTHTPPAAPQMVKMIWIPDPRPAARGGGGQPKSKTPPKVVEPPVVATQPSPVVEPPAIAPEPEQPRVIADAAPAPPSVADGNAQQAGLGNSDSPGPGSGPDRGSGNGGTAPYAVGNGVTSPIPLRRPSPAYTAEAMRARLQGVVVLNCVVQPDGTCSDIRVARSLDTIFGLDQQAIASAREWRFRPGMRSGQPVPVLVTLEIAFTIR